MRKIPANVVLAMLRWDIGELSRLGKIGVLVRKQKKEERIFLKEFQEEELEEELKERAREANEHICPVD